MTKEKKTVSKSQIKNDLFKFTKFLLSVALIIFVGYAILNWVPFVSKYDNYIIATPSMEPVINVNDVVIIDNSINLDELEAQYLESDEQIVIAIYHDIYINQVLYEDQVFVHYLNSIYYDGDNRNYLTNGYNGEVDPWVLEDDDILGVYVGRVQKIGKFLRFAQSDIGKIILIVDVVVIYILVEFILDDKSDKKKKNKESIIEEKEETK
ncbi:hypothetical protein ACAG96_07875 [Candidatus Izemoplasma sp. B36]|uniref:hypothetical protein n=1 Tax=Candidatus Izemoplasma sp. B36 TaxID=3242468 RepID=UPI00355820E5